MKKHGPLYTSKILTSVAKAIAPDVERVNLFDGEHKTYKIVITFTNGSSCIMQPSHDRVGELLVWELQRDRS